MTDVLLTGIGGQGVLSTSAVLARAAQLDGFFVRGVTLHGLAQRGGSTHTFIRFSKDKVFSPSVLTANADLILAFEPLEALRVLKYASKEKTAIVVNDYPLTPIYSNVLKIPYPKKEEIMSKLKKFSKEVVVFNAFGKTKEEYGNILYGNLMLLGISIGKGFLNLSEKNVEKAILCTIKYDLDKNLKAFREGVSLGKKL